MGDMPTRVYVVSHTHWDREWHLSFQEYRVRLLRVIEKVLKTLGGNLGLKASCSTGRALHESSED
jgi:alpha-mannosidase